MGEGVLDFPTTKTNRIMTDLDSTLDDVIKKSGRRRPSSGITSARRSSGGAGGASRSRGSGSRAAPARQARARAAPYASERPQRSEREASDMEDVTMLKVSSGTKPNAMAGAICNVVRKSSNSQPPSVMATGPAAINQAIKGFAIARKYLMDEDTPIDFVIEPQFEQDVRDGSNVVFSTEAVAPVDREPLESDLSAKDKTDCFKLAGAVAGRVRDGEEVAITTKGSVPVLVAVKAIALAQDYVRDEGIEIKFAVQFRDLTDPELRGSPESTFLHFAIVSSKTS